MVQFECAREDDVLMMVATGRWPQGAPSELREHADQCQVCRELGLAAAAVGEEAAVDKERIADVSAPVLPSSGIVWWRAQLRARQEAARQVVRPITAAQMLAFAAMVGVAGAVFGATTEWFQRGLQSVGRVFSAALGGITLPSMPALPQDFSSVSIGYWIILLVVGIGLVAGAAVVSWAMKEE